MRYEIDGQILTDIADSIREKTGKSALIKAEDMAGEIDGIDGYPEPTDTVNEILYNHDFSLNTTGQTSWDATNSGTSSSSRTNIIDGWNIMQCTAEKVAGGLKIIPKKAAAYLTCQIPQYWFVNKTVTLKALVNGAEFSRTGVLSWTNGMSFKEVVPFGMMYTYKYSSSGDAVFTLCFENQIDVEFLVSSCSMKLASS